MEYTSPEIANYNISLMSITVLKSIVSDIQSSFWFSIIVDEATDISRNEHVIVHQWTDDNYQIYEECLNLVQLSDTKADTIISFA